MKLLKLVGIISVDSDITDQLLMRYFAFIRFWRKNRNTEGQYVTYLLTSRILWLRTVELLNILIEFDTPIKLITLIKMCLK
jgi:hypothetical protein